MTSKVRKKRKNFKINWESGRFPKKCQKSGRSFALSEDLAGLPFLLPTYLSCSVPSFDSQTFTIRRPPKPKHLGVRQATNHDVNTVAVGARLDEFRRHFGTFHHLTVDRYDLVPDVERTIEVRSGCLVPPGDSVNNNTPVRYRCLTKEIRRLLWVHRDSYELLRGVTLTKVT